MLFRSQPQSLVAPQGKTANDRRALAAITSANNAPANADSGVDCSQWSELLATARCNKSADGDSFRLNIWWLDPNSLLWAVDSDIGTKTVTEGTITQLGLLCKGACRVYAQVSSLSASASADVWLTGTK